MKVKIKPIATDEILLSDTEFLASFNKNMPTGYPHLTVALLNKFKEVHPSLFKGKGLWTLDQHRKRIINWLPQNV